MVLRQFLNVSTLTVLRRRDMTVSYRRSTAELPETSTVKTNTMVQIAIHRTVNLIVNMIAIFM